MTREHRRSASSVSHRAGVYVHVPYCQTRCGYCDFNTYVPGETGRGQPQEWSATAQLELRMRAADWRRSGSGPASTVFFGGGTPTLLPPAALGAVLQTIDDEVGLMPDVEITIEANPETIAPGMLTALLAEGFTRISIGMQSADERVLATLDRQHTPGRAVEAVAMARAAGFEHVSLDLIYGTPGENLVSWEATVRQSVTADVDHVSAYGLKVETGTRMARQIRQGQIAPVDDDYAARAYEIADRTLTEAGLQWYEISNWARNGGQCQHNLGYWRGADWLGIGPGAHGHTGGTRYWNEKLPARWQQRVASGILPTAGSEKLGRSEQTTEVVMLGIRLAGGLALAPLGLGDADIEVQSLVSDGFVRPIGDSGRLRLTQRGRLLADTVTIRLLNRLDIVAS